MLCGLVLVFLTLNFIVVLDILFTCFVLQFSLFKRKALKGQKNVSSKKEDESGKPLQSEEEEKDNIDGEDSKDENQNHTLQNSRETVANQDGRTKSSTCILL